MNRTQMNQLEKRLVIMRRGILALGKFGMSYDYYMRELTIMDTTVRAAMRELEREQIQEKLF